MKKFLIPISIIVVILVIIFLATSGNNKNDNNIENNNDENIENVDNNDSLQDENYSDLNGNYKEVSVLASDDSNYSIKIKFNADRFAVEEYFITNPQATVYFTDKSNGNNYNVYINNASNYSTEDYYNKMINTAKRNIKSDSFKATEMQDVNYGGVTFKKFSVSWSKEYEYTSKETGELVSGISNNSESTVFAELESGIFLRYEGSTDEEVLENLFVKITK